MLFSLLLHSINSAFFPLNSSNTACPTVPEPAKKSNITGFSTLGEIAIFIISLYKFTGFGVLNIFLSGNIDKNSFLPFVDVSYVSESNQLFRISPFIFTSL